MFLHFPTAEREHFEYTIQKKNYVISEMISIGSRPRAESGDSEFLREVINWAEKDSNLAFMMFVQDSNKVTDSYNPHNLIVNLHDLKEENGIYEIEGKSYHVSNLPIIYQNEYYGNLIIGTSLNELYKDISRSQTIALYIILGVFLVGIIISLLITKMISRPILKLHEAAEKISRGDYNVHIEVVANDELGALARNFNTMTMKLQQFVARLENEVKVRRHAELIHKTLFNISEAANKSNNLLALCDKILTIIKKVVPTDNFFICLYESESDLITFPYYVDEYEQPPNPRKLGDGLIDFVIKTGEIQVVDRNRFQQLQTLEQVISDENVSGIWIGIPLIKADKIIGAMVVKNHFDPEAFDDNAKEIFGVIASHVAGAIEYKKSEDDIKKYIFELQVTKNKLEEKTAALSQSNIQLESKVEERTKDLLQSNYELEVEILERRKKEEELLKVELGIERLNSALFITDVEGKITFVNPGFENIYGYKREEVIGNTPRLLKSDVQPKEFYDDFWKTILTKKELSTEFVNKTKDGRLITVEGSVNPIINKHNELLGYLAIQQDITFRKLSEKELILAKENAEKADRLKTAFLAQMSHEIRTPINAMVSLSGLLKEDLEKYIDDEQNLSFELIEESGKRIIRTVDLLLNISEIQTSGYEPSPRQIDLYSDILSKLAMDFRSEAKRKNLEFDLNISTKHTALVTDYYSINQIFIQLIDNAIKYTSAGKVTITVSQNEEKNLVATVTDTGIGITDDYLPKLFTPFSQEEMGYSRSFDGNGIGLTLVKKYCDVNNVKISVESKKGVGTTFMLVF